MADTVTQQEVSAGFTALKGAIEETFAPGTVEGFLKKLDSKTLKVRQFEEIVPALLMKQMPAGAFSSLSVFEQAKVRELYLSKVEEVDQNLRRKFIKVYSYYY
jgi:hypothetical protein